MALSEKDKKQLTVALGILAIAGAGAFWMYVHTPNVTKLTAMQVRYDSLSARVDSARRDLARGSVEALRERARQYQQAVHLMRRLVPAGGEVPNLIDDVSSRAKVRGVTISQWTPLPAEEGSPFQVHKYRYSVVGHYDQLGEFLSDVASLPRIMVPTDLTLAPVQSTGGPKVFKDSTGALLEASFQLRTFVKSAVPTDSAGGTE
jgi:type IV pilus assembly protein PilO